MNKITLKIKSLSLLLTFFHLSCKNNLCVAIPNISGISSTLKELISKKTSIARFGDGEINLIRGQDIPFQQSSSKLQQRLIEILSSAQEHTLIAIPKIAFEIDDAITSENKNFWHKKGKRFKKSILPFLRADWQYGAAEVSLAYSYYENYDFAQYFADFRKLWQDRDIVIITGKTVFDKLDHNIFDNAQSVEFIYGPNHNAFENYEQILSQAKQIDKHKLIIAILGPTATVLAYDLGNLGFQALDLGHIAKSYDYYMKGIRPGGQNCTFYKPD